jgi:predicted ArsR family transcriptional regulator
MSQKITAPETLSKTQERILDYLREHPQASRGEVARGLGLSRETVSRLVNEKQVLARVEPLHEDILGDVADMASLAALAHTEELGKLLRADDERDRVRAAEMILVMASGAAERQMKTAPDRETQARTLERRPSICITI